MPERCGDLTLGSVRVLRRLSEPWALGAAVALLMIAVWAIAGLAYGTQLAFWRPADDAYYYYDIVRSTWTGMGVSTDGIHATSGFHPLWFVVLLPFGAVLHAPDAALVTVAQLLGMLLFGVAVAGIATALRLLRLNPVAAALGALALLFAPWRGVAAAGVEGALALALLSWFIVAMLRAVARPTSRSLLAAGVVAGLTVLARLDTVFVVGTMLVFAVAGPLRSGLVRDRRARRDLELLLGPPIVLVGTYLVVNLAAYGSPLPITASLKSGFPDAHFSLGFVTSYPGYYVALPLAWIGTLVTRRGPARAVVAGLAVGATCFGVYELLFARGVFWWHFVSVLPAGAVGTGLIADWVLARASRRSVRRALEIAALALAVLLVGAPLVRSVVEHYPNGDSTSDTGWRIEAERAGHWAGEHLPPDAMLAMTDSGAFGYYTEQPVMNLDGVISNREFNDAICDGRAVDEMVHAGVRYVVHHSVPPDYKTFTRALPCWARDGRAGARLTFSPQDEVYRSEPYWRDGSERVLVIWRFDDQAVARARA